MHYLLIYEVVKDYATLRVQYREAHLAYAKKAIERGELLLGGAFANPVDGAVLLFNANSPKVAETFAMNDSYVVNGLVIKWNVREWTTVVGPWATEPVNVK
ncbi:MAG: hypothetical protein C0417_07695 [Chlorobiaceae bacterium]|nr:hypothetical protein [Chlorobiaceae bacterium]